MKRLLAHHKLLVLIMLTAAVLGAALFLSVPADATVQAFNAAPSDITASGANQFELQDGENPHAGLTTYDGAATCLPCHQQQALDQHASVHFQWRGETPYVVNAGDEGKITGVNDFCGHPLVNAWLGKMVNIDGVTVDGGCATCHMGTGIKPGADATDEQLASIDCLICHSDTYRRTVALVDGIYRMVPAPEKMSVTLEDALANLGSPSKAACVACHAYGGGGPNNKRGDIEPILANPPTPEVDVHMSPVEAGGQGFDCVDCHVYQDHRVPGRGSDLMPTDVDLVPACADCHTTTPHSLASINQHTARVNCTVCHIQTFARHKSTDMYRDFTESEVDEIKRLYEPKITRESNVIPEYRFFNGYSTFYLLGAPAQVGESGKVLMAGPLGSVQDAGAKISPFKHHQALQPYDLSTGAIIPLNMGIVFQTGDMPKAILSGAQKLGWALPLGYDFIPTERYMQINHTVTPAKNALTCNDCHYQGTRMDFDLLGYTPKTEVDGKPLCTSCHGAKNAGKNRGNDFYKVHNIHVTAKSLDCSACHNFSKAR